MKKILLTFLTGILAFAMQAQGLHNIWSGFYAQTTPALTSDVKCAHLDASGNLFTAGIMKSPIDVDAMTGGTTGLYNSGSFYIYFVKYNSAGTLLLAKQLNGGSTGTFTMGGIVSDASGNIYITGRFFGTVDFDPGAGTANLVSTSGGTGFLAKYNSAGTYQWARNMGNINFQPEDVAINPVDGNIWIAGWYVGNSGIGFADVDPGAGTTNMLGNSNGKCLFFCAYNPTNGNYITNTDYTTACGTLNNNCFATSIAFNSTGELFTTGYFYESIYLGIGGGGASTLNSAGTGNWSGYIMKNNVAAGRTSAVTTYALISTATELYDLDLDASSNVYIAGYGASYGGRLYKYNTSMVSQWSKTAGNYLYGVDVDATNLIYVTGLSTSNNLLVQKYNSVGTTQYGASGYTTGNGTGSGTCGSEIKVNGADIYIGGHFYYTSDIGFDSDTVTLTDGMTTDVFLAKYQLDNVPPTVTISSSASSPTVLNPIPITLTFSEPVIGLILNPGDPTNATVGNLIQTGATTYTAELTPTITSGTIDYTLINGICYDYHNNSNDMSNTFAIVFDNGPPSVVITTSAPDPTNVSPIPVTITFNENVTGFTLSDISVTNGTASGFVSVSGMVYTANISPTTAGTVSINVNAGVCIDGASYGNTAALTLSRVYDNVSPGLSISSTSPNPTNTSPIPVTFTFTENVSGFTLADISVTNGTASGFAIVSGSIYTANITPASNGTVSVNVSAAVCNDGATNPNTAATTFTRIYDNVSPGLVISSTSPNPTNTSPIPVTFTFTENVSGFTLADISVTNGTASGFAIVSGSVYTANITPSLNGTVSVNVSSAVCNDGATNPNTAAGTFSIVYDNISPTALISSTAPDPTNVSPIPVTVTFDETVVGFALTDIVIGNGIGSNFTSISGTVYTFDITPSSNGTVTASIAGAVCGDQATNPNAAASTFSIVFNNANPTVAVTSTTSSPTNSTSIPLLFTFSVPVTGFVATDVVVTNGSISGFSSISGSVYSANLIPTSAGTVTITVPSSVCMDGVSNPNLAGSMNIDYDNISPNVLITTTASDPTTISPIPVLLTFSEDVTGFDISDLIVGNGTPSNFIAINGTDYSVDITPTAPGILTVDVSNGSCNDVATNSNNAAAQFSIVYQLPTGIETFMPDENGLLIYPVPSSGNLNILCGQKGNIEVIDMLGKKVYEQNNVDANTVITFILDKPGSYICRFSSTEKTFYSRFMITK